MTAFKASFSSTIMAMFSQPKLEHCILIHMQNLPPQNMPLGHKDYFELIIFEKLQTLKKL